MSTFLETGDRSASSWDAYVSRAYEAGLTAQLQHVLPWQKEMKVLDVGTGTGYLALTVAPMVGEVIGVDSVPSMLRPRDAQRDVTCSEHR